MSINLTDEIEVKTKKGKLGAAKQIFLEGDTQTVENEIQNINSRHNDLNSKHESLSSTVSEHTNQIESNQNQIIANKSTQDAKNASLDANMAKLNTRDDQITELVRGITATGGASVATTVAYDNTSSHLASATVQGAIDELQGSKIDKTSILQKLGNAEDKVMSQKAVSDIVNELESQVIYDVTANNDGVTFGSLSALLSDENLSTLIPSTVRCGGMSIRFIQSSDNKYVQFRCKTQTFSANSKDWAVCDDSVYVGSPNPEWIKVVVDADRRILGGIKRDGSIEWYKGVPVSVKTYIDSAISDIISGTSNTDIDGINKIIAFLDDFSTSDTLKSLIDEKVNVEEGKSLIPTQFIKEIESLEYIECHTDNNKRVLYGVDKDGNFVFGNGVPRQIDNAITDAMNNIEKSAKEYTDESITALNISTVETPNIIYRKRYDGISANIEDVIDISTRKTKDVVFVGVFASDYMNLSKKFNVLESADGITYTSIYTDGHCNDVTEIHVSKDASYIKIVTTNISSEMNIGINVWSDYDCKTLFVASSTSESIFKNNAHFVCDGVNDEVELDEAMCLSNWHSIIQLGNGIFYIDSFIKKTYKNTPYYDIEYTDYGVMTNTSYNDFDCVRTILGFNKNNNDYGQGTRIYVRESAFENVPSTIEPYVISGPGYGTTGTLIIKNLTIKIENNQHKVVCINGAHLGALTVDTCSLSAGANAWSETLPVEGCVGLRGVMGDCNGTSYYIAHTYAGAFYEGFQLGGEHLVMIECGGRFNYYCYTFGNYDYGSAYNNGRVTDTHPLTLINCCDEGSRALPKFVKSGMYSDGNVAAKQQIDLIGFNMEIHNASLQGAVEVTSGAFCGTIDFVAYGSTNTSKNTPGPDRRNRVDVRFWASDNDGKYFRTTNAAHAEMGSTSERLGYWAQKMQKYFDTDLNKMLVCTSEDNQVWKDFNGITVVD